LGVKRKPNRGGGDTRVNLRKETQQNRVSQKYGQNVLLKRGGGGTRRTQAGWRKKEKSISKIGRRFPGDANRYHEWGGEGGTSTCVTTRTETFFNMWEKEQTKRKVNRAKGGEEKGKKNLPRKEKVFLGEQCSMKEPGQAGGKF